MSLVTTVVTPRKCPGRFLPQGLGSIRLPPPKSETFGYILPATVRKSGPPRHPRPSPVTGMVPRVAVQIFIGTKPVGLTKRETTTWSFSALCGALRTGVPHGNSPWWHQPNRQPSGANRDDLLSSAMVSTQIMLFPSSSPSKRRNSASPHPASAWFVPARELPDRTSATYLTIPGCPRHKVPHNAWRGGE